MRIAILDDDREDSRKLRDMIFNVQGDYRVDQYHESQALLDAVRRGETYELVFLDIYLAGENGMETARLIRQIAPSTRIAFTTVSREHAVDAYSIDAVHYLVKPIRQEDITEVFRRLKNKAEQRKTLTIRIDRTVNVLFQDEIIRVESHGHSTIITCEGDITYFIRKPFYEINSLLDESFIQVKKGVTLNMHHIVRMTYRECTTKEGLSYLLRRDRAKEIRERYYAFIEGELNGEKETL